MDQRGRLIAFVVTPGQRGDAPVAAELIAASPASETLAADRAYDSDALRRLLLARGTLPVIPITAADAGYTASTIPSPR